MACLSALIRAFRHVREKRNVELEILGEGECLRLLGTAQLGRVAYTDDALPAVVPVNFALHNGRIVFRVGNCGKLVSAMRNAVVAFEVDNFDKKASTGWSVTAIGYARLVREATERAELARLGLYSWAPGAGENFVVIVPGIVRGRRIPGTELASGADPAA